jgi:hypothetical protein
MLVAAVKLYSSNAMCSAYSGKSPPFIVNECNVIFMCFKGFVFLTSFILFFVGS